MLCNCVSTLCTEQQEAGAYAVPAGVTLCAPAAVLHEMCAVGVPAALRALLHESSALLGSDADSMDALPPVLNLVSHLLKAGGARCTHALLTDLPDSGALLQTLLALMELHPHARLDGTAPAPFLSASYHAGVAYTLVHQHCDDGDAAASQAVKALGASSRLEAHLARRAAADPQLAISEQADAAAACRQQLARRHGWDSSGGASERRTSTFRTHCMGEVVTGDCAGCGRRARAGERAFSKCARCQATPYCSKACQTAHWKTHKPSCKKVAAGPP